MEKARRIARAGLVISARRSGLTALFDDFDHMRNLGHHTADRGSVFKLAGLVHLVQTQTDQRLTLGGGAADRRADLFYNDCLSHLDQASSATWPLSCGV